MKIKMHNKVTPEFTMAAMTDFVFQLLIIFMLMSTLVKDTNTLNMTLPKSSSKAVDVDKSITVSIDANMQYRVGSQLVNSVDEISPLLQAKMAGNPDGKVKIAVDENVAHKYFVELADIVSIQNGYKMVLATMPKK